MDNNNNNNNDNFNSEKIHNENVNNEDHKEEQEERKSYASIPEDIYIEKKDEKKEKKGFKGSMLSYIAIALVASIIGGFVAIYLSPAILGSQTPGTPSYQGEPITINTSEDISTVSAVVKKSMESVVGITTLETREDFFRNERDVEGVGSGVIVNKDGYILTNSHVVANGNAKKITVLFNNGDQVQANLMWFDQTLDLAIIRVDITGLPAMELGDSDDLQVGELSIAIGNPLGLEFERTVTSGIISGLNRSVPVDQNTVIDNLIQTDAAINPGNSGGPLLNANGEVIGINTAKIKGGEGLGFSIPINSTKDIIKEVIEKGTFETVQLGIKGIDAQEYQSRLGINLGIESGVFILEVVEGSAAREAGIQNGDILLEIDGKEIESMQDLKKMLYDYQKDDVVEVKLIRNNTEESIELKF